MRHKNLIICIIASFFSIIASAQEARTDSVIFVNEDSCNVATIQSAIDACKLLAQSTATNDTIALLEAGKALKQCDLTPFVSLKKLNDTEEESLKGHLVFNDIFADSLLNGKDAYENADFINKITSTRSLMRGGKIFTKTILIKANGKSVYKFPSQNRQELAIVAEPGGLITTRIHAVNTSKGINEWHNDTTEVKKGRNSRTASFTLPDSPQSQVTLEITNCTNKQISVVVISN